MAFPNTSPNVDLQARVEPRWYDGELDPPFPPRGELIKHLLWNGFVEEVWNEQSPNIH